MKFLKLITLSSAWAQRNVTGNANEEVPAGLLARRYTDLLSIVYHYNPDFDERKYWAYGCNCLMLGDRPMSEGGKGKPVDDLDVTCQHYKQCQKCARMTHGEECIGEMVKYEWEKITGSYDLKCTDKKNTCKRALCECDLDYAKKLKESLKTNKFNDDYHLFWSKIDWNPKRDCIKKGGKSEPQCCGPDDGPKELDRTHNNITHSIVANLIIIQRHSTFSIRCKNNAARTIQSNQLACATIITTGDS